MAAAIEFEFKGNLAQLKRDLNEASRLARASASETSRTTGDSVAGLFRRTPERRAERAFAALGTSLATGDVALGIAAFSEKLTGLGLAAGVGVGVAIGVFEKFRHEINEATDAYKTLQEHLAQPAALQGALGPEGIGSQLEAFRRESGLLAQKQDSLGFKFAKLFRTPVGEFAPVEAIEQAQEATDKRIATLSSARAESELKIANLKLQAVTTSQKDAELAKIALDAEEKRAALLLSRRGGDTLDLFKSKLAIDVESQAARLQVEKKFAPKPSEPQGAPAYTKIDHINRLRKMGLTDREILTWGGIYADRPNVQTNPIFAQAAAAGYDVNVNTGDLIMDRMGFKKTISPTFPSLPTSSPSWNRNSSTGEWIMDYMGFKKTIGPASSGTYDKEGIGGGIDGIKRGIDQLNSKMDQYWS